MTLQLHHPVLQYFSGSPAKSFGVLQVEVIDPVEDYLKTLSEVFDFGLLKDFLSRPDFPFVFDALHAVTGAYAGPLFVERLGASTSCLL